MKNYNIIAPGGASFGIGTVMKLADAQVATRKSCLAKKGKAKGVYEVTSPVTFKAGENVSAEGAVNKALLQNLDTEAPTNEEAGEKKAAEKKKGTGKKKVADKKKAAEEKNVADEKNGGAPDQEQEDSDTEAPAS